MKGGTLSLRTIRTVPEESSQVGHDSISAAALDGLTKDKAL